MSILALSCMVYRVEPKTYKIMKGYRRRILFTPLSSCTTPVPGRSSSTTSFFLDNSDIRQVCLNLFVLTLGMSCVYSSRKQGRSCGLLNISFNSDAVAFNILISLTSPTHASLIIFLWYFKIRIKTQTKVLTFASK